MSLSAVLLVFLLTTAPRAARGECEGRQSTACSGLCCESGGADQCFFLPQCIIDGSCLPFRKRLAVNITASRFAGPPDVVFADLMKSHWRTPPELAHLEADLAHLRKRQEAGQCLCAWQTSPAPTCCPVHCNISPWSAWSSCSAPCGGGSQSRSRTITQPSCGGAACVSSQTTESQSCNTGCCPQNCVVGGWSSWGACSAGCGGGSQSRSRSITPESCGGSCSTSQTTDSQSCNTGCCPQNCVLGAWSQWSACSRTCGAGTQSRSRSVQAASCGGSCSETMPSSTESLACNAGCCAVNCALGGWSAWSACSAACGIGTRSRSRSVSTPASCGGAACAGALTDSDVCDTGVCCPVDCTVGTWSMWSSCSVTCGSGSRMRSRSVQSPAQCGGACPSLTDSGACTANDGCCPTDCTYTTWTSWAASTCSVTCGNGLLTRTRTVNNAATCGGTCSQATDDSRACTQPMCSAPAVDCALSTWSVWSACSATCGASATMSRTRSVTRAAENGGVPCGALAETTSCGLGCCPVACAVATWSAWSTCSATCGAATRTRTRRITSDAACGGTACPAVDESAACALAACARDCEMSAWSAWGACSQACGTGEQRRTRTVLVAPSNGGAPCGSGTDAQNCTQPPCECAVSAWSAWSACSATCGGGQATRSRTVDKSAADCPPLTDATACNTEPCPRDCQVGAWAAWSACSATCGGGRRERARSVVQAPVGSGVACPLDLTQSEECAATACAAAGLACAEYAACSDCADKSKTSGRCQFCVHNTQRLGVCQSLRAVEGDAASELRACAEEFNLRVTDVAMCPSALAVAPMAGGGGGGAEVTVDVVGALKLAKHETAARGDVVLSGGLRFQVRVAGEEGALLRSLGDDGLGAFSPSRDGPLNATTSNAGGRLRGGLSLQFLFPKDRPVSFRRLVLGEWDAASDGAVLEVYNDEFAAEDEADSTAASVAISTTDVPTTDVPTTATENRKRQYGIVIRAADSTFGDETAAGFTKYVVRPNENAEFTLKSFVIVERGTAAAPMRGIESAPGALDTTAIALIVVGAVLLVTVVVIVVVCVARRRKQSAPRDSGIVMRDLRPELASNDGTASLPQTSTSWASDRPGSNTYQSLELPRAQGYRPLPQPQDGTNPAAYKPMPSGVDPHYTPMEMQQKRDSYVPLPGTATQMLPPYQPLGLANQYTSPRSHN